MKVFVSRLVLVLSVALGSGFGTQAVAAMDNSVYADLGMTLGGMGFGFAFEHSVDNAFGVGGTFLMYPKDSGKYRDGLNTLAAFVRPHFLVSSKWDFYLSPGIGILMVNPVVENSENDLGFVLATGVQYKVAPNVALGLENIKIYSWSGNYKGVSWDYVFLNARFIF